MYNDDVYIMIYHDTYSTDKWAIYIYTYHLSVLLIVLFMSIYTIVIYDHLSSLSHSSLLSHVS